MLRTAVLAAALCVSGLTACGGGSDSPPANPIAAPTAVPPPPSPEEVAAMAAVSSMLGLPEAHLQAARTALDQVYYRSTGDRCGLAGSQLVTVDGTPWTGSTNLPAGKHALTARFNGCRFAGPMEDITLNGGVDMVYEGADLTNIAVVLTANTFSWNGVAVDGPASYSVETGSDHYVFRSDLRSGSSLTNLATTSRIDLISGRYARGSLGTSLPRPTGSFDEYLVVVVEFNAIRYVLDGRIDWSYAGPMRPTCKGAVRVTDGNGALVARKYCSETGVDHYELLKAVPTFW